MKNLIILLFTLCFTNTIVSQDGRLNDSFGIKGIVSTNILELNESATDVLIQEDGKILMLGSGEKLLATKGIALQRLNKDGSTDSEFGENGKVLTTNFDYDAIGISCAIQADKKIIVVGKATHLSDKISSLMLVRYDSNGDIDFNFGKNGFVILKTNNNVIPYDMTLYTDGKIVVVGTLEIQNITYGVIYRFNADGTIDNSFSVDGVQSIYYFDLNVASCVKVQSDGKILVGGHAGGSSKYVSALYLNRYNQDGSLDSTFDKTFFFFNPPIPKTEETFEDLLIQKDGKIVILSTYLDTMDQRYIILRRFEQSGKIDLIFADSGIQKTKVSYYTYATKFNIQTNGKLLVAAFTFNSSQAIIQRYLSNGILDNTFGVDGIDKISIKDKAAILNQIAIQSDGQIIGVGTLYIYDSRLITEEDMFTIRLNTDGSLDHNFGNQGKLISDFGSDERSRDIAIQNDGKILLAGEIFNGLDFDIVVVRYNPNGSLDTSFNKTGKVITDAESSEFAKSISIQSDGRIVVGGIRYNDNNADIILIRYNPDGSIDKSFDTDGKVITDLGFDEQTKDLSIYPNGKIVLGADYYDTAQSDIAILRYNIDGSLDKSFNATGIVFFDTGYDEYIGALNLQGDDKILVTGNQYKGTRSDILTTRINTDGKPDIGFNVFGYVTTDLNLGRGLGTSVVQQMDGKILVSGIGDNSFGTNLRNALIRYLPSGMLDTTFGTRGIVYTVLSQIDFSNDAIIQKDGKILVAGASYNGANLDIVVLKYNSNGSLDNTFNLNGIKQIDFSAYYANSITINEDGNIYICAESEAYEFNDFVLLSISNSISNTSTSIGVQLIESVAANPNPCSNQTTLQFSNILDHATIEIWNSNAQMVKKVEDVSGLQYRINLDNLIHGIYIVKVIDGNTNLSTSKMLVKME